MRSAPVLALTTLALGVLASSASAQVKGQLFYFTDPVPSGTPVNSQNALFDITSLNSFIVNFNKVGDTGLNRVTLQTVDYGANGQPLPSGQQPAPFTAIFYVSQGTSANPYDGSQSFNTTKLPSYYASNPTFDASATSGTYGVNEPGIVTFVDPNSTTGAPLLQIGFTSSTISVSGSSQGFGASEDDAPVYLGGSLLDASFTPNPSATSPASQTGADFSFGFGASASDGSGGFYRSSTLTASIGNAPNTPPVPEPTTLAALALGGLAVLRRRKRA